MKKFNILTAILFCCCTLPAHALSIAQPNESFVYTYDKNGDNKLSLKEFLTIKKSPDSKLTWNFTIDRTSFKTLDRNRDGFLDSKDELPIGYTQDVQDYIQCWPRCE